MWWLASSSSSFCHRVSLPFWFLAEGTDASIALPDVHCWRVRREGAALSFAWRAAATQSLWVVLGPLEAEAFFWDGDFARALDTLSLMGSVAGGTDDTTRRWNGSRSNRSSLKREPARRKRSSWTHEKSLRENASSDVATLSGFLRFHDGDLAGARRELDSAIALARAMR